MASLSQRWKRFALTATPVGAGAATVGALVGYSAVGSSVLGFACGLSAGTADWYRQRRSTRG